MPAARFSLRELAVKIDGVVLGPPDLTVERIDGIDTAKPGSLAYVREKKIIASAEQSQASALLIPQTVSSCKKPAIAVKNPRLALAKLLPLFQAGPSLISGIHPTAILDSSVKIGKDVGIGPYAVIGPKAKIGDRVQIGPYTYVGGNVTIGDDTILHSRVTLLERVTVGKRCILHEGCVIGSEGFGYASDETGAAHHLPHTGTVVLEDEVEIGANTTVDRALFAETRIGKGTKMDNLVHIAHNCVIGENCFIAALTGLAGSVSVGSGTQIGGLAGVRDHVRIGKKCVIVGGSKVWDDVPDGAVVSGEPARPHREQLRYYASRDTSHK